MKITKIGAFLLAFLLAFSQSYAGVISTGAGSGGGGGGGTVTPSGGSGTTNYVPKWTGATTLSSTSLIYDNGTNVGIGTTSTGSILTVNGAAQFISGANNDPGTNSAIWLGGSPAFATSIAGYQIQLLTGANNARTPRMTIDNNGNVGVNQTSPTQKLDVNGFITGNDGTQGVILGAFPGGGSFGALYPYGVTPTTSNYNIAMNNGVTIIAAGIGASGIYVYSSLVSVLGPLSASSLNTGSTAPVTTGTTKPVITDSNGLLSFSSYNSPRIIAAGAAGWTNTGLSTSEENLVSVPLPNLGANDQIRVYTLWTRGGTLTDTDTLLVRLSTTGCTPQTACNSGTSFLGVAGTTSSTTTFSALTTIANRNATNSQVSFNNAATSSFNISSGAVTTGAIQTNSAPFININCTTNTSSADSCKLEAYSIELLTP